MYAIYKTISPPCIVIKFAIVLGQLVRRIYREEIAAVSCVARSCIACCISTVVLSCVKGLICVARTCRGIDIRFYTESSNAGLICQLQRVTPCEIEEVNVEAWPPVAIIESEMSGILSGNNFPIDRVIVIEISSKKSLKRVKFVRMIFTVLLWFVGRSSILFVKCWKALVRFELVCFGLVRRSIYGDARSLTHRLLDIAAL